MSGIRRINTHRNVARLVRPGQSQPAVNPIVMDADELRDKVRDSLLARKFEDRAVLTGRIATGLGKAGLNIGATAVLLGIHQEAINDFTPSDIAHLIRYVRINNPGLLKAVSDALNELLPAPPTVADHAASRTRKAA